MKFGFSGLISFGSAFWDCNTSSYINSQVVKASMQVLLLFFIYTGENILGMREELKRNGCCLSMVRVVYTQHCQKLWGKTGAIKKIKEKIYAKWNWNVEQEASEMGGPLGTIPSNHLVFLTQGNKNMEGLLFVWALRADWCTAKRIQVSIWRSRALHPGPTPPQSPPPTVAFSFRWQTQVFSLQCQKCLTA